MRSHDDDRIARPCIMSKPSIKPRVEYGLKGEVGLFRINDGSARIDTRFNCVAL